MQQRPDIPDAFLWEYDLDTFHWDRSYKIVIERVLERGDIHAWREIYKFYGKEKILETIAWSAQLKTRDKEFSRFFLNSDFVNAA